MVDAEAVSVRVRAWVLCLAPAVSLAALVGVVGPKPWVSASSAGHGGASVAVVIFLAALLCEYIDSSLGMGYGTALSPMLLIAGFQPLQVVPCILLSELVTGLAAGWMHHRDGNVDFIRDRQARSTVMVLSLLSVVGAVAAASLAVRLPKAVLSGAIGVIILATGVVVLLAVRRQFTFRRSQIVLLGAVAAFNKGMSGGGFGPLVTSGQVVSGLSPRKAVAITSVAEALTCFVGLTSYLVLGHGIDWGLALPLILGALFSVPVATLTVRRLSERTMRAAVGVATCLLGLFTLIKVLL